MFASDQSCGDEEEMNTEERVLSIEHMFGLNGVAVTPNQVDTLSRLYEEFGPAWDHDLTNTLAVVAIRLPSALDLALAVLEEHSESYLKLQEGAADMRVTLAMFRRILNKTS